MAFFVNFGILGGKINFGKALPAYHIASEAKMR
jgi:hypothetical protein